VATIIKVSSLQIEYAWQRYVHRDDEPVNNKAVLNLAHAEQIGLLGQRSYQRMCGATACFVIRVCPRFSPVSSARR
jgi:hypothetical protein